MGCRIETSSVNAVRNVMASILPGTCCRRPSAFPVTGRFCAQDESVRNAGGTPGCGTADDAARRTQGTQTGSPPVPAGPGCRRPSCGAPAGREASPVPAVPVRTRNACTRVRIHRIGSLVPRPALCRAAAARAAGCSTRSCFHGRAAVFRLVRRADQEEPGRTSSPALAAPLCLRRPVPYGFAFVPAALSRAAGTEALKRQAPAASDLKIHFSEAAVVHFASSRPVPD